MRRFYYLHSIYRQVCIGTIVMTVSVLFMAGQRQSSPTGSQTKPRGPASQRLEEFQERTFTVEPGREEDAFAYYKATFDDLGLNPQGLSRQALVKSKNLSQMLGFLGYKDLTPKDAEDLSSAELMKRFPDSILSSAFFAPKITDVSVRPINVGWRKVIRFKAHGDAAKTGIEAGFLLFNKFQGQNNYDADPFKPNNSNESQNTQLILTRGSTFKKPVYFMVFGPISTGGKLITFLTASFDARAPNIVKDNKYYVPNACAECHGGLVSDGVTTEPDYERLKLNYLDTDHWFDRLDDDFAFLKAHTCGTGGCAVLYDAGKDESKPKFKQAFDVLRKLNSEIEAQNTRVGLHISEPSFQLRAVRKWLQLHQTDSRHKQVFARALPSITGEPWKATRVPDKELLPLLNQYCFRCHSSLRFNIFDRPAVVQRRTRILTFMNLPVGDSRSMPQDRNLNCSAKTLEDKKKILKLICALATPCVTPSPTPIPPCPSTSSTP